MEQNEYKAPEGFFYTNKNEENFFEGICLGKNDSIDNYHLIEIDKANAIIEAMQEQERNEMEAEE